MPLLFTVSTLAIALLFANFLNIVNNISTSDTFDVSHRVVWNRVLQNIFSQSHRKAENLWLKFITKIILLVFCMYDVTMYESVFVIV